MFNRCSFFFVCTENLILNYYILHFHTDGVINPVRQVPIRVYLCIKRDLLSTDLKGKYNSSPLIALCLSHNVALLRDLFDPFAAQVSYICLKKGCCHNEIKSWTGCG